MDKALLHTSTRRVAEGLLKHPVHAVLVSGEAGAGKQFLAGVLVISLLKLPPSSNLREHPKVHYITPNDKGTISIDDVKALKQFVKLKSFGRDLQRAIIVENAHAMTTEAQNAFLKLLEEPPADTVIIMTALPDAGLLPTILSRCSLLRVLPVSLADTEAYFQSSAHAADIKKQYALSQGQVGLLASLLTNNEAHPLVEAITEAKQLLGQSSFERLAQTDRFTKDKSKLANLIGALERICHAAMLMAAATGDKSKTKQWQQRLKLLLQLQGYLSANANAKLVYSELALNI